MRFILTIRGYRIYGCMCAYACNRVTRVQHCHTSHSVLTDDQIHANFACALAQRFRGFAHISKSRTERNFGRFLDRRWEPDKKFTRRALHF